MKLLERGNCVFVDEVFPENVIAGFTTTKLNGVLPADAYQALSFLEKSFSLSFMNQLHSANTHLIKESGIYDGDGIFTCENNHLLVVKTADCLPLLLYDSVNHKVGVIHMGWRSAASGILEGLDYDFSSTIVVAGIGLRGCCYEVGDEFSEYERLIPYLTKRGDKLYFDPINFSQETLCAKGLKRNNFYDINFCSFCMNAGFSYRKNSTTQRTLSFIIRQ